MIDLIDYFINCSFFRLPYERVERQVIIEKIMTPEPIIHEKPKNLIIKWQSPEVKITRRVTFLGAQRASPELYVQKYGNELKNFNEIKNLLLEYTIRPDDDKSKLAVELDAAMRLHESRVQKKLASAINFTINKKKLESDALKSTASLSDIPVSS